MYDICFMHHVPYLRANWLGSRHRAARLRAHRQAAARLGGRT